MKIKSWKRMHGQSLPHLSVAIAVIGKVESEIGFIYRPKNTKGEKNAWRAHIGIGEENDFVGHAWSKKEAKEKVQKAFDKSSRAC